LGGNSISAACLKKKEKETRTKSKERKERCERKRKRKRKNYFEGEGDGMGWSEVDEVEGRNEDLFLSFHFSFLFHSSNCRSSLHKTGNQSIV